MIGIYKITSPKKRVYIGQSINIEKRFKQYKKLTCKGQIKLYNSFLKYGVENHKFEILLQCCSGDLNEFERYYQDLYSAISVNGLNLKLTKATDRTCQHSEETKLKISLANKGKINTKEQIEKHIKSNTGLKRTEKQKKLFSKVKKGVLNPMYGKKIKESSKDLQRKKLSGQLNYLSKIILNTENGIFYFGLNEASKSINIKKATLHINITKNKINKTPFIYV